MKTFNPHAAHPARALQAWMILVGLAMNRQTVTYDRLSGLMYRRQAQGVLGKVLGHVAVYCNQNGLHPLTAIVVNSKTGLPGEGIPVEDLKKLNAIREKVFTYDWFNVYPPSENELRNAFENRE